MRNKNKEIPVTTQASVQIINKKPIKLDLACGLNLKSGFEGVDISSDQATHKIDLLKFPWPWESGSVQETFCSHFIEHIPMVFVDQNNNYLQTPTADSKDLFFAFFDEIYRILKPGGKCDLIYPYLQSHRAFQDPTHRRFIPEETFEYLKASWRNDNHLSHYNVECDFLVTWDKISDPYETIRNPETHAQRAAYYWNTVFDLHVVLDKPV